MDGALDAVGHHHRPRLAPDLPKPDRLLMEVVHHDFGLVPDRALVVLHVAAQLLTNPLCVELWVALHRLDQPVVAVHRRVVRQHVDDEAFLDRLLHAVDVERDMSDCSPPSGEPGRRRFPSVLLFGVAVKAK